MRLSLSSAVETSTGAVVRVTIEEGEGPLDGPTRAMLANVLRAIEMGLVDYPRDDDSPEEIGRLRAENDELRKLVAAIPPGSMAGVPQPMTGVVAPRDPGHPYSEHVG